MNEQPPKVIYLQISPDEDERLSVIEPEGEGVTWCEDQIYEGDVKYIRADLLEEGKR
jgi:hypothetical protein